MHSGRSLTVIAALLGLIAFAAPRPMFASAAACSDFGGPNCGDASGDAFCAADEDCVTTGLGCECRPRVCCKCETAPGTTETNGLCNLPCTQTGIGLLACVGACLVVDGNTPDSCNLKVVNQTTCSDGTCPTTGCCTLQPPGASAGPTTSQAGICVETDFDSCDLVGGSFVTGGSCAGGLDGACVAPTPTVTATSTATATATATTTATPTATATGTATASPTVTNTPLSDGASCTSPTECASTFCVDGVCCNTACNQPFDTCNLPTDPGTCVQVAPAPPISRRGLFAGLALLTVIGAAALWHQRRAFGGSNA